MQVWCYYSVGQINIEYYVVESIATLWLQDSSARVCVSPMHTHINTQHTAIVFVIHTCTRGSIFSLVYAADKSPCVKTFCNQVVIALLCTAAMLKGLPGGTASGIHYASHRCTGLYMCNYWLLITCTHGIKPHSCTIYVCITVTVYSPN